jgi:glycosyltransferase involved in cell wall biosynthesis
MSEEKRIKVLTISDHPLSPSGVGTQTKYVIEALLKSDKFDIISLGGAIKHPEHKPQITEEWGERWKIFPVDGYGSQDIVRSIIRNERPDVLYFMTDPRFYGWLWEIEAEVRSLMPMVYYHVWDNKPYPVYNQPFYESNDFIASISKVTQDIVENVAPTVNSRYVPHAVNSEAFRPLPEETVAEFRKNFDESNNSEGKFVFFWNNRNARRKQSGSLIYWFRDFLDQVGRDKALLIMHTDPVDPYGQNLHAILADAGLENKEVLLSAGKVSSEQLGMFYNMADCTINISDAEGFGLATLESLSCGTPILVNMTGGLQEQVTDGKSWFGIGLEPDSKAIIGSQEVPFIYEDRLNGNKVTSAMRNMYSMDKETRDIMGRSGREHVMKNYNFETFCQTWVDLMLEIHENEGSWDTRKYNNFRFLEVA